jgi:hypothetical protein
MGMLGMVTPQLRLPLCEMSEANEQRLRQALDTYGLLKAGAASEAQGERPGDTSIFPGRPRSET